MSEQVVKIVAPYNDDGCKGASSMRFRLPEGACEYDVMAPQIVEEWARKAIQAYLSTQEGREHVERVNFDFNWGDVAEIPDEFFAAHGLIRLPDEEEPVLVVDHDEVFSLD